MKIANGDETRATPEAQALQPLIWRRRGVAIGRNSTSFDTFQACPL